MGGGTNMRLYLLLGVVAMWSNQASTQLVAINDTLCSQGDTGCYFKPASCSSNIPDCDAVAAWTLPTEGATYLVVQINGKASYEWIALGLSESGGMDGTSVMACLNDGGVVKANHYYNNGYSSAPVTDENLGISNVETSFNAGTGIRCSFNRDIEVTGDSNIFPFSSAYTLLLGGGPLNGNNRVSYHSGDNPIASSDQVVLTSSFTTASGSGASNSLKKAHGCIMIAAWVFSATMGILTARHMKGAWVGKTLCGKAVWFPIHQVCMTLTFSLNIAGFVIIFVDVGAWSELPGAKGYQKAHPILGCIITALVILNPLMAACRPAPDAPKRPLFNWAHWSVGIAACILAIINVYFGMTLPSAEAFTRTAVRYMMIVFMGLFILAQLILEINKCCADKQKSKYENEMEMSANGGGDNKPAGKGSSWSCTVRYTTWNLWIMIALGLALAMIINIAMR